MRLRIFHGPILISHSSKDNEVAGEVRKKLVSAGHREPFLDFHREHGTPQNATRPADVSTSLESASRESDTVLNKDQQSPPTWPLPTGKRTASYSLR